MLGNQAEHVTLQECCVVLPVQKSQVILQAQHCTGRDGSQIRFLASWWWWKSVQS